MTITGAIVLFSVTWFMVFLCVLPMRQVPQWKLNDIVPGSARSAPTDPMLGAKVRLTTWISIAVWAVICGVILTGWISPFDTDYFHLVPRLNVN